MQRVNRSICVFESLSFISLLSFRNPLEIDYSTSIRLMISNYFFRFISKPFLL